MVPLSYSHNPDGTSPNAAALILSNCYKKPLIALFTTLFKSDLSKFDNKKIDEKPLNRVL